MIVQKSLSEKKYFEIKNSQTHVFSALVPETDEQMKLAKNKIRVNFQKMIRTLAFRGSEKFDNSFYFKILGIV